MSQNDLKSLEGKIPPGGKWELAIRLGCDPSKITKAFHGMVKSDEFLARLQAEAEKLIEESASVESGQ